MIYRKDYPEKPRNHKAAYIAAAISAVLLGLCIFRKRE